MRPVVIIWLLLSGIAGAAQVREPWREAPDYMPLLAPAGDRATAFRFYTFEGNLDTALRGLADDATLARSPGAWEPRGMLAVDAFGQAGRYDRSAMARLYGPQQPLVARGARIENGHVTESWTLISPYPDPSLRRLHNGTLLVVLRLP